MSVPFQPFPIKEFKSGINSYLQPWIRPAEGFDPLVNAYTYRGTITKRSGMTQFGNTVLDTNPIMGIMRYVNQAGAVSLLVATTVHLYLYNAGANTFDNIALPSNFSGNITNFFNFTNWQASSGATPLLYMVNAKDPITTFDGAAAAQPPITIDAAAHTITTALDVKVYKQRLLLIRPTRSDNGVQNQSIYWSAVQKPTNWLIDTAGNGGFADAPTGDIIISAEFLRDDLVVNFTNSTWIFKFTGVQSNPFVWIKLNESKSNNAPYGSISYDERTTSVGNTGLTACDGVNVQRYDTNIVDYYETNFSEQYFAQTFAQRYDNLNQGWMLYVSNETPFSLVGGVAPGSDSALIYNFAENTWATYNFSFPLTCLGTFYNPLGKTWAALTQSWASTPQTWNSFSNQKNAPILLAGGIDGKVWWVDNENVTTDNTLPITANIQSTRWNPLVDSGQKVQFGWIDIYYYIPQQNAALPPFVNLLFFTDNSENVAATRVLTLDGPVGSQYTFKRIYLNLVGEFIQLQINQTSATNDSYFEFIGFVIWARPAGRLTP